MRERPILFSAPMVRAILAGTKTQTRRVVKAPLGPQTNAIEWNTAEQAFVPWELGTPTPSSGRRTALAFRCPYGAPGDRLWVRETHAQFTVGEGMDRPVPQCVAYRATCDDDSGFDYVNGRGEIMRLTVTRWTSAIHMPRWASRITLEVTGVRVERLHDITDADARAEGIDEVDGLLDAADICRAAKILGCSYEDGRAMYAALWAEINGWESLVANPWVWVVCFPPFVQAKEAA